MRRLALFDLDGTLTRGDTFRQFVPRLLARHPARWPRALLLPPPVLAYALRLIGRGALKGAVLRRLFRGLPRATVEGYARRYAAAVVPAQMYPEAVAVLRAHLAAGDHVVVMSASPDLYVPEIGRLLDVHEIHCTRIRWRGERLDGDLDGPNLRDHQKALMLAALRAAHPGLPVIAYGNSAADLEHMALCEEGVYVNGSARMRRRLAALHPQIRVVQWR
ncbi:MAG TPA: HAD family hydrolase [Steroidobacteraceae bacterium]|nr:HAD family hydrolase [Steroidobacteraceae bacterium]